MSDNGTMRHDGVNGHKGRALNIYLMYEAVTVCHPLIAGISYSPHLVKVILLTPGGIGVVVPERAGPCSHGRIQVDVRTGLTQFCKYPQNSLGVFQGTRAFGVEFGGNAIELEVTHIVIFHHEFATVNKRVEVNGIGKLKVGNPVIRVGSIPMSYAQGFRAPVATDRAEPSTDTAIHRGCYLVDFSKAIRESDMEIPEAVEIIPAIVYHVSIKLDSAFFIQLALPIFDDIQ